MPDYFDRHRHDNCSPCRCDRNRNRRDDRRDDRHDDRRDRRERNDHWPFR